MHVKQKYKQRKTFSVTHLRREQPVWDAWQHKERRYVFKTGKKVSGLEKWLNS